MGRTKFSPAEIQEISRLLALKNAANRAGQKLIRHDLRTKFEFNISDFNEPGKAFGPEELEQAVKRRAIVILDEKTIADMKAKRARDRAKDAQNDEAQPDETTDWKKAMQEWEAWEKNEAGLAKEQD